MTTTLTAAAIQMVSTADFNKNLSLAEELLKSAAEMGAKLAVLPENWAYMGEKDTDKLKYAEEEGEGPIQAFMQDAAKKFELMLIGGAIPIKTGVDHRVYNSCLVYKPDGDCIARYDKIHLFDVSLDDSGHESYQESNTIAPGDTVVVANTALGNIGLSICYDIRFPELYRDMLSKDISIITVPSAFTETTGERHWQTLLRARAIENLCFVIAPNQGGKNSVDRATWGHSMIIDPWGDILASMEKGNGVICAELDLDKLRTLRENFPSLQHMRLNKK
jgi:predicted amidohydrolase